MASQNFTSLAEIMATGAINFRTDSFKMLLWDDGIIPTEAELDTWTSRNEATGREHGASGNYIAGGFAVTATVEVSPDVDNNNIEISFAETSSPAFASATISSAGGILYLNTGLDSTDSLIGWVDFEGVVASTNGDFQVTFNNPITITV